MSNDTSERQGATAGIVFAILLVVGFGILIPKPPTPTRPRLRLPPTSSITRMRSEPG